MMPGRHDELPDLPDPLKSDLFALYHADLPIPAELDRAMLNRARAHLARRSRLRWLAPLSAAAVILIAVMLLPTLSRARRPSAQLAASATIAGDMNHDARIDIRDALLLARLLDAGAVAPTSAVDVNHDGIVDHRDVDVIAAIAVKLNTDRGIVR